MQVVADNDSIGAVAAIRRIIESPAWQTLVVEIEIEFSDFASLSLAANASDQDVWCACQSAAAVLITSNRVGGEHSLTEVIARLGDAQSLPVLTIANRRRAERDRDYAERCAFALLDLLDRIESLRGTGRLFIP
jgi:hypothetical protein